MCEWRGWFKLAGKEKMGWRFNIPVVNSKIRVEINKNIAGRLPENSRNSFVELQSQKDSKRNRPKRNFFLLNSEMLYFHYESV